MLARSIFRSSARAVRPATFAPITSRTSRAAFNSSSKKNDPEVPVISYRDGERKEESINYDAKAGPVNPPGGDAEKAAIPLKPELIPQLTPTLQKFTLSGKVAVVTG